MNNTDRARLATIVDQANRLMNVSPEQGGANGISNADVIEALIGDVENVQFGKPPTTLAALLAVDEKAR